MGTAIMLNPVGGATLIETGEYSFNDTLSFSYGRVLFNSYIKPAFPIIGQMMDTNALVVFIKIVNNSTDTNSAVKYIFLNSTSARVWRYTSSGTIQEVDETATTNVIPTAKAIVEIYKINNSFFE